MARARCDTPPPPSRLEAAVAGTPLTTANMKRESKAYSYEDQKWEVEMKQEQLRKKKQELKEAGQMHVRELLKKAKLSQKQRVSVSLIPKSCNFRCHLKKETNIKYNFKCKKKKKYRIYSIRRGGGGASIY